MASPPARGGRTTRRWRPCPRRQARRSSRAGSSRPSGLNNDLQVARLRLLALYATAALALTLVATMIAANPHPVRGWPVAYLAS